MTSVAKAKHPKRKKIPIKYPSTTKIEKKSKPLRKITMDNNEQPAPNPRANRKSYHAGTSSIPKNRNQRKSYHSTSEPSSLIESSDTNDDTLKKATKKKRKDKSS